MTLSAAARWGLSVAPLVVVLDQLTKWAVLDHFLAAPQRIELLPVFNLVLVWNKGVSFGLFNQDSPYNAVALSLLALVIVLALLWWLRKAETRLVAVALGLIIGGAVGNVIDRAQFGAVVDFIDWHVGAWHWPAFNIADAGITVGAAILVLDALFRPPKSG